MFIQKKKKTKWKILLFSPSEYVTHIATHTHRRGHNLPIVTRTKFIFQVEKR